MNISSKTLLVAVMMAAYAQAQAVTEQFSYRFVDGELLTGTFTAQPAGSDFSDISNVHTWFDGAPVAGGAALHVGSYRPDGTLTPGAALISPQAGLNNFFFSDSLTNSAAINVEIGFDTGADGITVIAYSKLANGDPTSDIFLSDLAGTSYSTGPNYFKVATGLTPQWQLSAVPAVPEPAQAALLMAGLALLFIRPRRRK